MSFSTELITILNYLAQKLGIVIDWTSDNVMPYLQDLCARYIEYEILNSFMIIGGWALALIIVLPFLIPTTVCAKKLRWNFDHATCFFAVVCWIALIVCIIGLFASTIAEGFHIIECWKMPEKVIIEYIQGILNSGK